jgi:hypothetical protein
MRALLASVKPKDKVRSYTGNDDVTVRSTSSALSQVFGSVEPAAPTEAFKALEQSAREEHAERQVRRLQER